MLRRGFFGAIVAGIGSFLLPQKLFGSLRKDDDYLKNYYIGPVRHAKFLEFVARLSRRESPCSQCGNRWFYSGRTDAYGIHMRCNNCYHYFFKIKPSEEMEWILSDPEVAYRYAYEVIKGPWPPGEKIIATHAMYAYWYAADILKGPFPAGEQVIADSDWVYSYAINVLKKRFIAAEERISGSWYAAKYNEHFGTNLDTLKDT